MVYPEYLFKNKFQERILLCKTAFLTIFRHITLLFGQCQFEHFWLPSQLCRTLDGLPFVSHSYLTFESHSYPTCVSHSYAGQWVTQQSPHLSLIRVQTKLLWATTDGIHFKPRV